MQSLFHPVVIAALALTSVATAQNGKFTIYMGGKPVASETYTMQKSDGKVQIDGSGNAELGPMKIAIERFKVIMDDKYQPLSASAKATMGQVKMAAETTFADGKAINEITTGPEPKVKEDEVHADAIVINSNLPLFPWNIMALRAKLDNSDPQAFHAYVIGQSEVALTVVFKGRESVEFADKKAELNHLSATFPTPQGQTFNLEFWIGDDHTIVKMVIPAQGIEAYQDGWTRKAPPAAPKPDADKPADPTTDVKKKQP